MTWVAIDDRATSHPKLLKVGAEGVTIWLAGLCYCNAFATDGRVPKVALGGLYPAIKKPEKVVEKLVAERLWEDLGDHWEVHDYEHYQAEAMKPIADAKREKARQKKRDQREKKKLSPGDTGGQNGGHVPAGVPGTVPGTIRPPTRPDPSPLLAEGGEEGTAPPPRPAPDAWLLVHRVAEETATWMGDLSSEHIRVSCSRLVAKAAETAAAKETDPDTALRMVFARWWKEKPSRLRLPNWPQKLLEDWGAQVDMLDEETP